MRVRGAARGGPGRGVLAEPETLSEPGTANDSARIATNSPGVAALIWTEFANGRTPRFRIRVSTREPDGAWAPSEQLSGAGEAGAGAVGVDPQGRITAVWDEAGTVKWADKARASRGREAQAIPDGAGGKPDLFVASDGTATAVWQKGTTADTLVIRTARRPLGGAWSAVETISPAWSYRPHIEGDTAGDVTVSYTHDAAGGSQRYIYAVDRPNSGPWGTQTPLAGPAITDNISDLVVAPNSGRATVFWQDGSISAPLAARTRDRGRGLERRHDDADLRRHRRPAGPAGARPRRGRRHGPGDRGVDRRQQGPDRLPGRDAGDWTAPTTPAADRPGRRDDAARERADRLQRVRPRASRRGRRSAARTARSLRGPAPATPWSAPKPIDGVPADAVRARPGGRRHGPRRVRVGAETGFNVDPRWPSPPTATR